MQRKMKSLYLILVTATCIFARAVEEFGIDDDISKSGDDELLNSEESTDIAELNQVADNPEPDVDRWWGSTKIAFSTYLSKDYTSLGNGQHIKFDKVLLNDGDGYESVTGVFRAPVSGVYMFTYVVAQRHAHEIRTKLVSDGKTINGAIAEGMHKFQDVQGTNTAIIHVSKGKGVWVEAAGGDRLEGDNGDKRYTTYSGFLLYARR